MRSSPRRPPAAAAVWTVESLALTRVARVGADPMTRVKVMASAQRKIGGRGKIRGASEMASDLKTAQEPAISRHFKGYRRQAPEG